jgi:hypothetical protein
VLCMLMDVCSCLYYMLPWVSSSCSSRRRSPSPNTGNINTACTYLHDMTLCQQPSLKCRMDVCFGCSPITADGPHIEYARSASGGPIIEYDKVTVVLLQHGCTLTFAHQPRHDGSYMSPDGCKPWFVC